MSISPSGEAVILVDEPPALTYTPIVFNESVIQEGNITPISPLSIPVWNSSGRPEDAKAGTVGFNTQTETLDFWDGNGWLSLKMRKV